MSRKQKSPYTLKCLKRGQHEGILLLLNRSRILKSTWIRIRISRKIGLHFLGCRHCSLTGIGFLTEGKKIRAKCRLCGSYLENIFTSNMSTKRQ